MKGEINQPCSLPPTLGNQGLPSVGSVRCPAMPTSIVHRSRGGLPPTGTRPAKVGVIRLVKLERNRLSPGGLGTGFPSRGGLPTAWSRVGG